MNFIHEFAFLIAIAIPVVAIVGLQALLFLGGERGTLLWPSARPFETGYVAIAPKVEAARFVAPAQVPANDERERQAA